MTATSDVAVELVIADNEKAPISKTSKWTRRKAVIAAIPGTAVVVLSLVGPAVAPYRLGETVGVPFRSPGHGHLLGTDSLGRDVWSQILHGGRMIIVLPLLATVITTILGGLTGILLAYARGRVDGIGSHLVDVAIAMPAVLVLLVLVNGWGSSPLVLIVVVVVTTTPYAVRYARAATLRVVNAGFVEHATAIGENTAGVIVRELVPNVIGPVLADASLRLVGAIYLIASASFLGFGSQPPATDWARMMNENLAGAGLNPWSVVAPAMLLVFLASSVMTVADRVSRTLAR